MSLSGPIFLNKIFVPNDAVVLQGEISPFQLVLLSRREKANGSPKFIPATLAAPAEIFLEEEEETTVRKCSL